MQYKKRFCEERLAACFAAYPCVVVTGAWQVGKSTLLAHLAGGRMKSFTFEPDQDTFGENSDPEFFLRNNPPSLILDEIQYASGLVSAIKSCEMIVAHTLTALSG
jgi:predicted AAA+ superfamily ATPase